MSKHQCFKECPKCGWAGLYHSSSKKCPNCGRQTLKNQRNPFKESKGIPYPPSITFTQVTKEMEGVEYDIIISGNRVGFVDIFIEGDCKHCEICIDGYPLQKTMRFRGELDKVLDNIVNHIKINFNEIQQEIYRSFKDKVEVAEHGVSIARSKLREEERKFEEVKKIWKMK